MSENLLLIETLARGAAIGALIAMGASFLSSARGAMRVAGVYFCISIVAYAINTSPALHESTIWLHIPIHFLSLGGAGVFWLFIVVLFEDRALSPRLMAPWALLTCVGLVGVFVPRPQASFVWIVHNLIEAGLGVHVLYVIAHSWRGDLVETRRRLRGPFLTLVTLYVLTLSGFEIAESLGYFQLWFRPLGAVTLALYCFAGAAIFLQARPALFGAAAPRHAPPVENDSLDSGDRAALAKLDTLMSEGEAWRREGLTIGALAEEVGIPEHRLRPLINDHLGFRNFAAFVNARRIDVAKAMLSDPAKSRQTVAAIAYDLGFGSLGPFNRAFKEAAGVTPTKFRKAASAVGGHTPSPQRGEGREGGRAG